VALQTRICAEEELMRANHHRRNHADRVDPPASAFIRGLDALARIRTGTALATAPSRQRVYQFHHQGLEVVTSCEDGTYRRSHTGSSRP